MYPHVSVFADLAAQCEYAKAFYRAPYYAETDQLRDNVGHERMKEADRFCSPRVARLHFGGFSARGGLRWVSPHGDRVSRRSYEVATAAVDELLHRAYTMSSQKARVMRLFVDDFLGDRGAEKTLAKLLAR